MRESEALAADSSGRIGALERELQLASESLRKTVLEYETMNEELRSANEEPKSVNEELQSTNEELETAKEEQQSLNGELTLLNAELRGKLAELSEAHDDLNNLLNGTGIATLLLDTHLCIKRFTREATLLLDSTFARRPAARRGAAGRDASLLA